MATIGEQVAEQAQRLLSAKSDIADYITGNGVEVPVGTTLDGYRPLLDQIQTEVTFVEVPSQSGVVIYTGDAQSPTWNNYNSEYMTIGGVTSATDPGVYTAAFTPKAKTYWTDMTRETKYVTWAINGVLAYCTPEVIQMTAKSGQAANLWCVGDSVPIALNGTVGALPLNDTYYAFILGFNHNSSVEGGNSIHFQFGKTSGGVDISFVDSDYNTTGSSAGFRMNATDTNSGGWKSSYMRQTICAAFLSAMPTAWQNVIAACTKYSDNTGGGSDTASYVTSTSDKIWLLAEFEVFGARTGANSAEQNYQKQYDYYKNGNSKVKYNHNATTTACYWWLRSVFAMTAYSFRRGSTSGSSGSYGAHLSIGFAPGFMVT